MTTSIKSRLILLGRRLDERESPVRIDETGCGRFRLRLLTPVRREVASGQS